MIFFNNNEIRAVLISDIHGNLPALDSVLADIKKHNVSHIWNLGDIIGYCPYPNEVIERLVSEGIESICGNYDDKVLEFHKKKTDWQKNKSPEKYYSFNWNDENLSKSSREYLQTLPRQMRKHIGDHDILLVHGSPLSPNEYLTDDTPPAYLESLLERGGCNVIAAGHTHKPMAIKTSRGWVVNPGSVGRPEGDVRASYSLLRFGKGSLKVKHFNVAYDIGAVAAATTQAGMPRLFVDMIEQGLESRQLLAGGMPDEWSKCLIDQKLKVVESFARSRNYEQVHSRHVAALAVKLFDGLKELGGLDEKEDLFLLEAAGILHDIGWAEGQKGHHKTGMEMILADKSLPFDKSQRVVVALVVRSHRKSLLTDDDKLYAALDGFERRQVDSLGAILRFADGLDRTHGSLVTDVQCRIEADCVRVCCIAAAEPCEEMAAALKKSDLFVRTFGKNIKIEFRPNNT